MQTAGAQGIRSQTKIQKLMDNIPMLCSTIIPTIGRYSVKQAVESVLMQNLPGGEFEVIVVNDSGSSLLEAAWQKSERVKIINTNKRERSVARNTGAAMARGKYLHFLDDDDWLAPDAYQHLWELSQSSHAKWLYGVTQLIDRQHRPLIQLRHNLHGNSFIQAMSGEWIPLQASWIERETFLRIGGFNPLLAGPEDVDLLRRLLLEEEIAETPNIVAHVIMEGEGSTTDHARHPRSSRWAREGILEKTGVYNRMISSAVNSFWQGRISRVYLTSTMWNLQHWRPFTAMSRFLLFMMAILHGGTTLLTLHFWKAVIYPYASITFENGHQEAKGKNSLEH
jgi:glycosyltransferase involved in cell wall biosynthesis